MIDIKRKEDCVGCGACHDVCPADAIYWITDIEGFWYPKVEVSKCINCGLCEKVCPVIHSDILNETNNSNPTPIVLASYNSNEEVRRQSTSGGIFSALAEKWLDEGGYIGGAVWTEEFGVRHILSNKKEDLSRIMGSKYLQSDMTGIFNDVKLLLDKGEKVLICGCPCQMAGLRRFIRKEYDNLLLVDFICCSINSPKLFKEYIKDLENQYGSPMIYYHPKNKEYGGWHNFAFKARFENGSIYHRNRTEDDFTNCFIGTHLAARPSCFECHFKKIPRVSDITIGDFWGIENIDPEWDSPDGVSVVLLNNDKGQSYYKSLGESVVSKKESLQDAVKGNAHLIRSLYPSQLDRNAFYETLDTRGFRYAMDKYGRVHHTLTARIKRLLQRIISRIKAAL